MKEYKELEPLSRQYLALAAAEEALAEAKELLYVHDAELSAMAAEQKNEAEAEIARLTEEARLMLLPHDPRDDRSVIMELRAVPAGKRRPFLRPIFTECTICTRRPAAGRWS